MKYFTKILLTINLEGVLGSRAKEVSKIVVPYEHLLRDENGDVVIPVKWVKTNGVIHHNIRDEQPCKKVVNIGEKAIQYWLSDEGYPSNMEQRHWKKLPNRKRIVAHLKEIADGHTFSYELI